VDIFITTKIPSDWCIGPTATQSSGQKFNSGLFFLYMYCEHINRALGVFPTKVLNVIRSTQRFHGYKLSHYHDHHNHYLLRVELTDEKRG